MPGPPHASIDERLALDPGDAADEFVSRRPTDRHHVFGGLLIAQSLRAASLTVDGREVHALHGSFVTSGEPEAVLHHRVERTRDGTSFTTRRVTTTQAHGTVFVLTADFHHDEEGAAYELPSTPGVPGPDELARGRYDNPVVESRDVPVDAVAGGLPHTRRAWFRVRHPVGDDPALGSQAVAYLSDYGFTRAAREPHAHLADDARRQSVSLDHSIWFHRPAPASGWLLSEVTPIATGRGRGLSIGTIRDAGGTLIATVAQEVLLRTRP